MSTNPAPNETIAFFGATGGCGLAALTLALQAGYTCTALCRTPSKLTDLLTAGPRSLSADTLKQQLTVHAGSAKDAGAVRAALSAPGGAAAPVSLVVFSIGGKPLFWPNPLRPRLDDPAVCEASMAAVLAAAAELAAPPPFVVALSTTGLPGAARRDLPWLMLPLYRLMLANPHADKERMEGLLARNPRCLVVRPSLLTDGAGVGVESVRAGTEDDPAVGYTISREDVGAWLFERVVRNPAREEEWGGKKVAITY